MAKAEKDLFIVLKFIETYCNCNHREQQKVTLEGHEMKLCQECLELSNYAIKRRLLCPKDPKPSCKNCDTHCYAPRYRKKIREVMKFSGIHYIKRGRLDYLFHYFR
ncbi:nitrous oxide-stimulated promoter family protein [Desulfofalx alkaliphila]|uniref:nitrous oxide-stimulated promoter family protein n=1 Tax=Desulfofalx alkaliphila TaxID=105483 RepID=UPI0004E24439|nr:nitrous oxide-stimulated promoter family protein [Desulfofalx alkaliphila]